VIVTCAGPICGDAITTRISRPSSESVVRFAIDPAAVCSVIAA
jgi:hypothetical protein